MKSKVWSMPFLIVVFGFVALLQNCGGSYASAQDQSIQRRGDQGTTASPNPTSIAELVKSRRYSGSATSPGPTVRPTPDPTNFAGMGKVPGPRPTIGAVGPHKGPNPPANASYSIVYTSSPRFGGYPGVDLLKTASDVRFINHGFEETDLEIKNPNGEIIVIKNCTSNAAQICAAQEGRVSPDGTKIAYSLGIGNFIDNNYGTPIIRELTSAHIYIYDIASNTSKVIPNQGPDVINRMPDWLSNTELVYSSNAANKFPVKDQFNCHQGVFPPGFVDSQGNSIAGLPRGMNGGVCISQSYEYGHASKSMQIFKMNIDGSGQTNLTPHEYMAIRPTVLKHPKHNGRIIFSSWQSAEDKGYYKGAAGPGTIVNLWWLMSIDTNGGDQTSIVGAHHSGYINKSFHNPRRPLNDPTPDIDEYLALRSVGEDTLGRVYFTNYYNSNHFGLGNPYRLTIQDFHTEGCSSQNCYDDTVTPNVAPGSGQYIPEDLFSVAPFGVGTDEMQNRDSLGRAMGKLGFMARLSNGRMLATLGQGFCYIDLEVQFRNAPAFASLDYKGANIRSFLGGEPVCDRQIVELQVDRVIDPFDPAQLKIIAGDPDKHEWDAQEIPPASAPKVVPGSSPPLTGNKCYLAVVDIRTSELTPAPNRDSWDQTIAAQVGVQANAVKAHDPNFHFRNIKSLAIYGIELWDEMYPNSPLFVSTLNYHGFKDKWLMGVTPMETDGSVKVQVPCDKPFQMSGLDAAGTVIAHDTTLHSLRRGETRTCYGCHEGHSVEKRSTYSESPSDLFSKTLSAKKSPQMSNGKIKVAWSEVASIIENRCSSCHTGFQNDSLLWSRVAADQAQLDFPWLTRKPTFNGDFMLPRPYFSNLVARHPRWSPLYWACKNRRNDGYTNASFQNDIDFKVPSGGHKSGATAAECKKIADWIQLGAPNK